ncbi:hypothetical protein MHU86_7709 [Fragilaria crotonensis]|nr:hypothetical protein MHU86_7709 [Fragilaria crotonensis]
MLSAFAPVSNAQRSHPDIFSDSHVPGKLRGSTVGQHQVAKDTRLKPTKGAKQGGAKKANKKLAMNAPKSPPTNPPTPAPQVGNIDLDFTMLPYNVSVVAPSATRASSIGSTFIFNDPLYDLNLTVLDGTLVGGLCHKTQLSQPVGSTSTLVGGGYCFFTFHSI